MQYTIALAGKGGTGKTTMAGLLVKYLVKKNKTPILAVDADCNANFNEVLGLEIKDTLGKFPGSFLYFFLRFSELKIHANSSKNKLIAANFFCGINICHRPLQGV